MIFKVCTRQTIRCCKQSLEGILVGAWKTAVLGVMWTVTDLTELVAIHGIHCQIVCMHYTQCQENLHEAKFQRKQRVTLVEKIQGTITESMALLFLITLVQAYNEKEQQEDQKEYKMGSTERKRN